jgi:hypothetical protein
MTIFGPFPLFADKDCLSDPIETQNRTKSRNLAGSRPVDGRAPCSILDLVGSFEYISRSVTSCPQPSRLHQSLPGGDITSGREFFLTLIEGMCDG